MLGTSVESISHSGVLRIMWPFVYVTDKRAGKDADCGKRQRLYSNEAVLADGWQQFVQSARAILHVHARSLWGDLICIPSGVRHVGKIAVSPPAPTQRRLMYGND